MFGRLIDFWDNHVRIIGLVLMIILLGIAFSDRSHAGPVLDGKTPVTDPDILRQIEKYRPHSTSEWKRFDTLHEAAIAAAARLIQCSHYYECSGVIVKDPNGKFALAPVRTDYNSDNVRIAFDTAPADWDRAAAIHSHPCLPRHHNTLFSPPDIMGAIGTRTTFYMVDLCNGDVHEFIPGVTKPDDVEMTDGLWVTGGKIIGHVTPPTESLEASEGI